MAQDAPTSTPRGAYYHLPDPGEEEEAIREHGWPSPDSASSHITSRPLGFLTFRWSPRRKRRRGEKPGWEDQMAYDGFNARFIYLIRTLSQQLAHSIDLAPPPIHRIEVPPNGPLQVDGVEVEAGPWAKNFEKLRSWLRAKGCAGSLVLWVAVRGKNVFVLKLAAEFDPT